MRDGPTDDALLGFDWANPAQRGSAGWFQIYAWYNANHGPPPGVLREIMPNAEPWTATDSQNPIFNTPAPPNQADPRKVVASYFVQDSTPKPGTVVLIALQTVRLGAAKSVRPARRLGAFVGPDA